MPNSKIIKNAIMLLIIIASVILITFSGFYLFNNFKEGLTNATGNKPYNVDNATRLATKAIDPANLEYPDACNSKSNKNVQSGLDALDATGITNPVIAIYNGQCDWIWQAVNGETTNNSNTTATNNIALLQNNVKIAQDKLEKFIGYTNEYTNDLETVDNKLDTAQYEKKQAQDAIDRAAASIPSTKTLQDTITAQTDKILADAKILTAKQDQAKLKVKLETSQANVAKVKAELDDAKSKLIATQTAAQASATALTNTSSLSNLPVNANPPSVIATTAGTPSGYQNTCQFDSVPGLTSGDNSATAISLYFGNLLQNLLTIVKHDQTHNAIANAYNILTNSGNTAYSTNLVSSQSALNPQAGYPTMNYPGSSTTDLADYTAVNANINNPSSSYNTSNSQPCSGSYPLAYNCLSNDINF